jgi:squalene synthase HpnC
MRWDFQTELLHFGPNRPWSGDPFAARAYCARVARSHYENFTVVSALLPRRLVRHFQAVYAFCRWADDLADETAGGDEALRLLDWWRDELLSCYAARPTHPVTVALAETVRRYAIPPTPFLDLISAFEQDQRVKRYATFAEVLDYCTRSANPVGRLVLHLFECFDDRRAALSDEVCTGLQLANFWQDVARDRAIGRVYLPQEDMARFGVTDEDLIAKRFMPAFGELLAFQVQRARRFFDRGAELLPLLPAEARVDVDLFIRGGRATLAAIERAGFDVLTRRPTVGKWTKAGLLIRAVVAKARAGFTDQRCIQSERG